MAKGSTEPEDIPNNADLQRAGQLQHSDHAATPKRNARKDGLRSYHERVNRPCILCGKPVGRFNLHLKKCDACRFKGTERNRAQLLYSTANHDLKGSLAAALVPFAQGDRERADRLAEQVIAGASLRLFLCACGSIYVGSNHRSCDTCVSTREEAFFPGRRIG